MKKRIFSWMFVLSCGLGFSQQKLTLNEALKYALDHKAEAVKAQLEVKNSEYKIEEVRANALPQINVNGGLTYNAILQRTALDFMGQTTVVAMGRPWQSTATVSLNQQIFNLAVFTGLKAAKSTKEFYLINAELTEEQIIEKVATSYYEVYRTKEQIETIDKTIANTKRVRGVIQSLYNNGLAKKIDLDRIIVSENNLESSRLQLVNALELQENSLKYLIGMDIQTPIELPDSEMQMSNIAMIEEEPNIENRTEMKLLQKQKELLELNKKATQAQGYPALSLQANYGYLGMGDKLPWFQPYPTAFWSNFSSIGLNLSIPVFNGGSIKAKVKQAQNQLEVLEVEKRDAALALGLDYKNSKTQINNSLLTIKTQKENVALAKEVLENIENNYKYGLASLTDLIEAENSYAQAQNNYINALLDYKLAEVKLAKSRGELKLLLSE